MNNGDGDQLSFEVLGVAPELIQYLSALKITAPTTVQSETIPAALEGKDVVAVAQTGSGKTLAYALPALTRLLREPELRTLILAPSREMAQQIHGVLEGFCEKLALSNCLVIGGLKDSNQTSQLKKNPRIIVATPGRMNDHLVTNKLLLQRCAVIVIDEADRMLDLGFQPQLEAIRATLRGNWQTMMFSATFGPKVDAVSKIFIKKDVVNIRTDSAEKPVSGLSQQILFMRSRHKNDALLKALGITSGGVLVFADDQTRCEIVASHLRDNGVAADMIHGALSQGHRDRVIRDFRAEKFRVLVATDLLARGLDVPQVDHVISFDLPYKAEDFLHRIGRTARAGRKGRATTFVTPADAQTFKKMRPYIKGASEVRVDPDFRFPEFRGGKTR